MNTVKVEMNVSEYAFERAVYACQKAGKDLGKTVKNFLRRKVDATSTKKGAKK